MRWLILTVMVSCVGFAYPCLFGGGGGGGGGNSGSGNNGVQLPGCPTIITRSQWGARSPKKSSTKMSSTPAYALIHHGTGSRCYTQSSCMDIVKSYQRYHMDNEGYDDIGYNFIVGEDGNVYEGRGWDIIGSHAGKDNGYNSKSLGICVIGDFSTVLPNSAAQNAVKSLLSCAESNNKLTTFYTLRGHRDVRSTECPGQRFYDLIKTWNRY